MPYQDWAAPGHDRGGIGIGWQQWTPEGVQRLGGQMEGQQQQAADMMSAAAQGQSPSAAEAMLAGGAADMQQRLRNALASSAASQRGLGFGARQAAAQQAAAQAAGQMGSQTATQAAQLRANEMAQARQALAQQLAQMRGQDIQGLQLGQQHNELLAAQNRAALEAAIAQAQVNQARHQGDLAAGGDFLSGIMGGASGLLGGISTLISDERAKESIEDIDDEKMRALLGALKAKRYDYRSPRDGGKRNVGIVAQDLERSELGRDIVREVDHPDGRRKALDVRRALSAALASAAHLHGRVAALEGR